VATHDCSLYHPRRPEATPLYRLVQCCDGAVRDAWEERYERRYGFWRAAADKAVGAYLDCGLLENGFARVRCGSCRAEYLVAFSSKGRGLCPSCAAQRGAALAAFLREEVLGDVGHAQWVFSIPKMLRPYFLYHRPLLGWLCRAAYETAREMIGAALPAQDALTPGMIAVVQTFGDDLNWHPHVHALVTRGGWDRSGAWTPVPFVAGEAAALLFRHKVLAFLTREGLLDEERARLLLSWRHSGFSVHTSVTVPPGDGEGLERLARYLLRPPVSLERLHLDEQARTIAYARRPGHASWLPAPAAPPPLDPDDFLARMIMHIPEPRLHVIRYYGAYSSVVRARRRREEAARGDGAECRPSPPAAEPRDDPELRALRRRWADLIRRIYEVDPLVCPRCGSPMRIIAFITEPRVIGQILKHLAAKGIDARSPPEAPHNHRPAA
jgi:hypothetical protein